MTVNTIPDQNFVARLIKRFGPSTCLIDAATEVRIGPEGLASLIVSWGASLLSVGLRSGDRMLIGCSLSPFSALVYLGAVYAGLVAVLVEERVLLSNAGSLVKAVDAKAVWTETYHSSTGIGVRWMHGDLAKNMRKTMAPAICADSDLAALMPTSGSTGTPRFVMVTHGNLNSNTEAIIRSQKLAGDERAMLILPLSYCFGASVLHSHLYQGGSVVFDRRFMFPNRVLQSVREFDCTTFAGVPTVYNVLLRRSDMRQISLPSLRRFLQAGGALSPERIREMRRGFPAVEFYVMYGQTEATARISCMEPARWHEKQGSVGRPLDNLRVRIVDENGRDLPTGQTGELLVRGPSVCPGYFNDREETHRVYNNGWLRTKDLAHQDEEGYLWIEGRRGSFAKMRGIRVSLSEIEATLMAMPEVYECAARAVFHPEAGEALVLFIVPDQNARIDVLEIRRRLPAPWAIDSIRMVCELPKTSSGKVALQSIPV